MNRFCSIFGQLLKLFPRNEFELLVKQTRAQRHARGFTCWGQFVAMLFCQLGRAQSLREICGGLASCEGKLVHLGIKAPSRSTLAYANAHRPWELYQGVFETLLARCRSAYQGPRKFRFKNKLLSLDASMIDLCATLFDWAKYQRTKGAVKLHLVLDHDGYLPAMMVITDGHGYETKVLPRFHFEPGTIVVVDRGYFDYAWFQRMTLSGVIVVTRPRTNMVYETIKQQPVASSGGVVRDEVIRITSLYGAKRYTVPMRRIEFIRADNGEVLTLLTNNLKFAASTIAAIYKERWQIELFFKALKQNLKVKSFVGVSSNALKIQIWTALIAMLILRYLQLRARWHWSLSNLVALLRMNLFVHRDLWHWLDQPFEVPDQIPQPVQTTFAFA